MRLLVAATALLLSTAPAWAAEPLPSDAMGWLQRMAAAARSLNYTGVFVYRSSDKIETSRKTHYADASGEYERLEILDGPPREVIRNNDEVKCYYPEKKVIRVEKRRSIKNFPALLPEQLSSLSENYNVRLGGQERVAGFDCQLVVLEPKDGMRYGHKYWADTKTGLLIKSMMIDDRGRPVEQFAFTQLAIGGPIDKEQLRSRYAPVGPDWREDSPATAVQSDSDWLVTSQPRGFRKVMEMKRSIPGSGAPLVHIMLSDGLAGVSVFIEPMPAGDRTVQGISRQGAINVFTRPVADYLVTVLGEAPAVTLVQIGNSVAPKGGKP